MHEALSTRSWNGTPIARRTTDGYVNATAMAQASGKEWFNYAKSDRATTYMEALSRNLQMEVADLVVAKPGSGTWIHPRLAVDFARWISAEFAVWMDAWFVETVEAQQVVQTTPAVQQLPAAVEIKAAVECVLFIHDALEARNLVDDRNRLELKRNLLTLQTAAVFSSTGTLPGTTEALSPAENLPRFLGKAVDTETALTVVEFASVYLDKNLAAIVRRNDSLLGKITHQRYQQRHGTTALDTTHLATAEARKRRGLPFTGQANNGSACSPKIYFPKDWDLIIEALWQFGKLDADVKARLLAECRQFRPSDPE